MWRSVDVVLTDVSEERIASIFRVEGKIIKSASEETVRAGASRLMSEINSALYTAEFISDISRLRIFLFFFLP
jgi:hypothetical protein